MKGFRMPTDYRVEKLVGGRYRLLNNCEVWMPAEGENHTAPISKERPVVVFSEDTPKEVVQDIAKQDRIVRMPIYTEEQKVEARFEIARLIAEHNPYLHNVTLVG